MVCAAFGSIRLAAQSPLTAGVTVGTVKLTDARSEQALTGVVRYEATPWLGLSVMPAGGPRLGRDQRPLVSSSGLGDLPLSADVFHAFATPGSPVVAAALTVVLPEGNATCGLGSGKRRSGSIWVSACPRAGGSASRPTRAAASAASRSQSALAAPHATSLRAEAGYELSPRWRADLALAPMSAGRIPHRR